MVSALMVGRRCRRARPTIWAGLHLRRMARVMGAQSRGPKCRFRRERRHLATAYCWAFSRRQCPSWMVALRRTSRLVVERLRSSNLAIVGKDWPWQRQQAMACRSASESCWHPMSAPQSWPTRMPAVSPALLLCAMEVLHLVWQTAHLF